MFKERVKPGALLLSIDPQRDLELSARVCEHKGISPAPNRHRDPRVLLPSPLLLPFKKTLHIILMRLQTSYSVPSSTKRHSLSILRLILVFKKRWLAGLCCLTLFCFLLNNPQGYFPSLSEFLFFLPTFSIPGYA